MKHVLELAAIAGLFFLASCAAGQASLDNQELKLVELNGTALESDDENPCMISFQDNRMNATVGCNSIFAVYAADSDGSLSFTEGGATKMACPDEIREDEFLAAFNKVARYEWQNDAVIFYDGEGNKLFKAQK